MTTPRRFADLRGGARLAIDAVKGVTRIVEGVHGSVVGLAPPVGKREERRLNGISGLVYRSIHGTTNLVGLALDGALAGVQHLLVKPEGANNNEAANAERDAVVSALNGVVGDHLESTRNPLAIEMQLVRPTASGPHPLLLVHGLCMNEHQWTRHGHDHGQALASSLGFTPIYLRYNTGRHIADNGASLASLLETALANWRVPVERFTIIGHSMGGLVARNAVQHAVAAGMAWPRLLKQFVSLGTPYYGAALERGGNWLEQGLGVSPYLAPFTRLTGLRSAGITDLRHGELVPLPSDVASFAIAGALGSKPGGDWRGDGLVTQESALGDSKQTFVAHGVGHLDLLSSEAVYARLNEWLAGRA